MLKVIVTFAVRAEFATWRHMSHFQPAPGLGMPAYLMRLPDAEIYAVITGIGMRSIENQLSDLLVKQPTADLCIASGLAGSLTKEHTAGAILVARAVKSRETGCKIRSNASLVRTAEECGAVGVDYFFTSNVVVNTPGEKLRLGTSADAVEMESFHVLGQAERAGVPAVAVRAISDDAETDVPIDFNQVIDHRGQISRTATLYEITRAPKRVPQLIRFGLDSARARRRLADFLDRYVKILSKQDRMTVVQTETT